MGASQGLFRRNLEYVAVKPIRLSVKDIIKSGTVIKIGDYKLYQIRRWFALRRIGIKGSEWVKSMLKNNEDPLHNPLFKTEDKPKQKDSENVQKKRKTQKVKNE